ncbi:hypothetical protein SAMN02799636_04325 [Methylobacterium sp. 275MFSha3.1]|nr:hypothetical protein SAMN02799636_04325 [Methylobacterium sp. 275MFSha3.1]
MVTVCCDNPEDAERLPHNIEIGVHLVDMNVDHEGEAEDALNAEVVAWIKANISRGGAWGFFIFVGDAVMEECPTTKALVPVDPTSYLVRFRRWSDAFQFKMRWV